MINKVILTFLITHATLFAIALENATLYITKLNGDVQARRVKLEKVEENVWRFKLPKEQISEDTKYISVLNDWAIARKGEDGFFLTQQGEYGTFRQDEGKVEVKRQPVQVFGMKTPRGCFASIIKGLKLEYTQFVDIKNGVYKMYPRFDIADIEFAPYEDIIIDFYKLPPEKSNYSAIAEVYRNYVLSTGKIIPLAERIKGNPTLKNSAETMYLRIKFGRCDRRSAPSKKWKQAGYKPKMVVDHTFDDAKKIMQNLKDLGMDDVEICFVGWHKDGHDGPFPDLFPVPNEFGGEEKMKEAVAFGKSLGYRMTVHTNHHNYYAHAKRFNPDYTNKNPDGSLRVYRYWPGGKAYHSCFKTVLDKYLDEDIKRLKEIGINGTYHVDVTSVRKPTQCCNKLHPLNKQQMADVQNEIGRKLRKHFGGFSSEGKMDHVAETLDYGLYTRWTATYLRNNAIDKDVPLNELVYNGIILSNPYYATIDAPYERKKTERLSDANKPYSIMGTPTKARLKVIEWGGRPTFYYIDYSDLKPMLNFYQDWQKLKYLQYHFMIFHDEISQDVFISKWSNGDEIITNYSDKIFSYKNEKVEPLSYKLYKK